MSLPPDPRVVARCLLLSPHIDDVAFSLGGALLDGRFTAATVMNVFTLSASSEDGDGDWRQVTAVRKREDHAFFTALSTPVAFLDLDRLDVPLRLGIPDEAVFCAHPSEPAEEEILASALGQVRADHLIAPLGLGGHVDHRLVHRVARDAARGGAWSVAFYEDLPYAGALTEAAIEDVLCELSAGIGRGLRPQHLACGGAGNHKLERVAAAYRSQLGPSTLELIERHGRARAAASPLGERLWWVK